MNRGAKSNSILCTLRTLAFLASGLALTGCVKGPPSLTPEQKIQAYDMEVFESGFIPERKYTSIGPVEGLDCSGGSAGSRVTGTKDPALYRMKQSAVGLNADSVVEVWCEKTGMLNNCWVPMVCRGTAIKWAD